MAIVEDRVGLDRSVLSYIDVGLQPQAKYYLVIDEGMGQKALFTVDNLIVAEYEIAAYRGATTVVRFSPQLSWRLITSDAVYLQDSKTVYEREITEQKELHDLTKALRERLVPTTEIEPETTPGQYI